MSFRGRLERYIRHEATPAYKYGHQPRLYELTRQIAGMTTPLPAYDDDIVYAAAFLHDLGVFIGHRPEDPAALAAWDHIAYACERAPALLLSFDFPKDKVPAVLACIGEHLPASTPSTFEAKLLRDADILEQLGAIGTLRTAAKVGNDTRVHGFADVRASLRIALRSLPAALCLEAARELAAPRIAMLEAFLAELDREAGQHLG